MGFNSGFKGLSTYTPPYKCVRDLFTSDLCVLYAELSTWETDISWLERAAVPTVVRAPWQLAADAYGTCKFTGGGGGGHYTTLRNLAGWLIQASSPVSLFETPVPSKTCTFHFLRQWMPNIWSVSVMFWHVYRDNTQCVLLQAATATAFGCV